MSTPILQTSTSCGGSVNGILWGYPSFICIERTRSFQRVWPLSHGSPLQPGDSGSCVFDATTKAFYGHIVAGSTTSRIAYVVSAQEVFNDIEKRLSRVVEPSSSAQPLIQAPQIQSPLVDGRPGREDNGPVVF
ncbi:hypothetical protein QBC45DRAFT_434002 [Copromyces sp. CBS 386.78]|nr:hypothetical protein QBC45DRAFT_434002 [Copromyces sp. CBS 386.78]